MTQTRRRLLTATLSLARASGFVSARRVLAEEGAPEVTSVRIQRSSSICNAPGYVAQELLRTEGFTDIRYVSTPAAYDKWREYDAEDTIRFDALRLRETGFIKSSPLKIIADGTDWRFLNEIKRELKT